MQLSQGRANAVIALLISKYGIAASRLVAPDNSDANKGKNRRVELRKI